MRQESRRVRLRTRAPWRLVVGASLVVLLTPSAATAAGAGDAPPPDEVLELFDEGAAAAFTTDGAAPEQVTFGTPRTVHRFTQTYMRGDARGDVVEPDGTWIAPAFDGDGRSIGTALVWYPDGAADPEVAAVEWDPHLGERLAAAPADPLVHFPEANLWFTLHGDELRGLDGSQVVVEEYGTSLTAQLTGIDATGGGAQVLVPDSAILQPRGSTTALAIGAAVVLAVALLRRRWRGSRGPASQGETSG
ncbi:hypothetical protein [Cellulomonas terrae]|uniref:Gram-positive cocci surface proteins LPxTG domain-containing protein n=1 Tax=Cellulomonas terrae TaxID=311234 RepID=A0A511JHH3_9CELL|nr:hypothetical protein [Cellulomonas terrae]GEL97406.1 hypothetical protein CTE05_09530 [Cellulomonas terrae]